MHHHKSGNFINHQFYSVVREVLLGQQQQQQLHEQHVITTETVTVDDRKRSNKRRVHDSITGCPNITVDVDYVTRPPTHPRKDKKRREKNRERLKQPHRHLTIDTTTTTTATATSTTDKIILVKLNPTDFFCDLTTNVDVFYSSTNAHASAKFIFLIRDPLDMAISNYLFHSQYPTPEKWVHKYKPCESFNRELYEFIVTGTSTSPSSCCDVRFWSFMVREFGGGSVNFTRAIIPLFVS